MNDEREASCRLRANLYRFLRSVFSEAPGDEAVATLGRGETLGAVVRSFGEEVAAPLREAGVAGEAGVAEAREDFQNLLRIPVRGRYVTPYESVYRDERKVNGKKLRLLWGPSTVRVEKFYRAAGLAIDYGSWRELPDHVSSEMAFLEELALGEEKALAAGDEDLALGHRVAARRFLDEHLLRWLPQLCERIEERAKGPFYRGVARLALAFVRGDVEELRCS